jgi:RNA polymerase sigma factor (sigma-70 family)
MSVDKDASLEAIRSELVSLLPRLRRYAIALSGSMADGDDLTQDTLERALKNLHQWQPGTHMSSWLFRIARNRFIDTRRAARHSPTVSVEDAEGDPSIQIDGTRGMEASVALRDAARALQALPFEQREALALVLIDGSSYRDAADTLGIPIGTLTSRIARGREALAQLLQEN